MKTIQISLVLIHLGHFMKMAYVVGSIHGHVSIKQLAMLGSGLTKIMFYHLEIALVESHTDKCKILLVTKKQELR